ncbi:MAG TPA: tail fiber domain-containing protein [Chthonomonadaceae bacterium]|nr:tail fiber domain-containing protein [Chthonomonadaceae bacterium]
MKQHIIHFAVLPVAVAGLIAGFAPGVNAQTPLNQPLQIGGNATPPAALPGNAKGLLLGSNSGFQWIQTYGGPLILNSNGGRGGGNCVGIGLTNPIWTLDVAGTIQGTGDGPNYVSPGVIGRASSQPGVWGISNIGDGIYGQGGNAGIRAVGTQFGLYAYSTTGLAGYFHGNVMISGNLTYSGALTHASDARYKIHVQSLDNALDAIRKLHSVTYDYNRDAFPQMNFPATRQAGFIAQEVQSVLPQLVSKDQDGYLSVDYMQVVPVLVEAIKEQQKQIAALKQEQQRLDALEARLNALTARKTVHKTRHPGSTGN